MSVLGCVYTAKYRFDVPEKYFLLVAPDGSKNIKGPPTEAAGKVRKKTLASLPGGLWETPKV